MSLDKDRYQAERWLETAGEDLDAATVLLEKEKYSHACFLAQQCAEKAVKALWYLLGEDPWGHSVQKLAEELPDAVLRQRMEELRDEGAFLDKQYIPARYPNGLPDLTPGKVYSKGDAEAALRSARRFLERARGCLARG